MSSLFAVLQNAYAMYFVLQKKLYVITYAYVVGFALNIAGNFYIKDYGIIAAAISTIAAFIVVNLVQYIYVAKFIRAEKF